MSRIQELPKSSSHLLSSTQIITSVLSVVKELIENALDSQATNVEVKIEGYGLEKIEIKDNGAGIHSDDIQFVAKSHCTSKITSHLDLDQIQTYGFRGEALAALCAVSNLVITTKVADAEFGHTYTFDYKGNILTTKPTHSNQGTSISALNLFANIPVRRQFYRADKNKKNELKKVEDILVAFGCIHTGVRFTLCHNQNLIWQKSTVNKTSEGLVQIFGSLVADHLKYFEYNDDDSKISIEGFLPTSSAPMSCSQSSQSRSIIAINKRPVRMKIVDKVLKEHFNKVHVDKNRSRYPICYIAITLPSSEIDVNFDPNKTAVVMRNKDRIIEQLTKILDTFYPDVTSLETEVTESRITLQTVPNGQIGNTSNHTDSCSNGTLKTHSKDLLSKLQHLDNTDRPIFCSKLSRKNMFGSPAIKRIKTSSTSLIDKHINTINSYLNASQGETVKSANAKPNTPNSCMTGPVTSENMQKDLLHGITVRRNSMKESDHFSVMNIEDDLQTITPLRQRRLSDTCKEINQQCEKDKNLELNGRNRILEFNAHNINSGMCERNRNSELNVHSKNSELDDRNKNFGTNVCNRSSELHERNRNAEPNVCNGNAELSERNKNAELNVTNKYLETRGSNKNSEYNVCNGNSELCERNKKFEPNGGNKNLELNEKSENSELSSPELNGWSRGVHPQKIVEPVSVLKPKPLASNQIQHKPLTSKKVDKKTASPDQRKMTAFDFFCRTNRLEVASLNPFSDNHQIAQVLTKNWNGLSEEEKVKYKSMVDENVSANTENQSTVTNNVQEIVPIPYASDKEKNEVIIEPEEKSIQLNMQLIKDTYLAEHKLETTDENALKIINKLAPGIWICTHSQKVWVLNCFRLQEAIVYHRLLETYKFEAEPLESTFLLKSNWFENGTFNVMLQMNTSTNEYGNECFVTDEKISANGFKIRLLKDQNEVLFEVIGINKNIPSYDLSNLREILHLVSKMGIPAKLSKCRPNKIASYLKGEAARIVKQSPALNKLEDVDDLCQKATCLSSQVCVHSKPYFHQLFDFDD